MLRRWLQPIILLAVAALSAVIALVDDRPAGLWVAAFFALCAALLSPLVFPRSTTDARAREAGTRPIVYWRPGCPFCLRLRASLGRDAAKLDWVDIWQDPAGAATVRAVADGNETVPTVVAGERSFVNPSPAVVRSLLNP